MIKSDAASANTNRALTLKENEDPGDLVIKVRTLIVFESVE